MNRPRTLINKLEQRKLIIYANLRVAVGTRIPHTNCVTIFGFEIMYKKIIADNERFVVSRNIARDIK